MANLNPIQPVSSNPISWNTPNLVTQGVKSLFGGGGGPAKPQGGITDQNVRDAINQSYQQIYGRAPTADETAAAYPVFYDPVGMQGYQRGQAFLVAQKQQEENTPENIYKKQQAQYLADAPKFADQIGQSFQTNLGRAATQDELTHFGALMASGQDQYQVNQALQQTKEYQNAADTKFQNQLQGQLQQSNSTYFDQYIAPQLQSQAALAGRSMDSSGLNSQLANAALQQNQGLQNFLAGVTAQNYQGSVQNAQNQYGALMGQQYGLQNAGVSNSLANQAANTQYGQNLSMYNLQQSAYNNYLNAYGKRNNGLGGLLGGVAGAGLGAYFGGPAGASAGYGIGSGLGNAGQSAYSGGKI